ncbi:MAG: hypothetical protein M3463_03510 [Verrucomicrobiota bacterium]|nr:hypothetical protein [Verrucomicrobiota bacterium]
MQPRLSIPFDGPIDVCAVSSGNVFLISLGDTLNRRDRGGRVVGINQVVWDVETNTLHVESDELLAQHTRYALIVTAGLRDASGRPVRASGSFRRFRSHVRGKYKQDLLDAIHAARRVRVREDDIVTASVFTTQSATSLLVKIRDQIKAAAPEPADFNLGPGGTRTVFPLSDVESITFRQQTRDNPPGFTTVSLAVNLLDIIPGAVGQVGFGRYVSPDYQVHPGEFIPPVGTRSGTPQAQGTNEIYFTLFLPSEPTPAGGWPIAIIGHGNSNDKQEVFYAASLAAQGIATIYINAVGHGFGPLGTLTVSQAVGAPVTFSAGGRGIDQNGDGMIANNEGISAAEPRGIVFFSDGIRQTAVDLMQLVRVIEVGMDVDGDGQHDLDPSRIYYAGHSLGGNYGTVFLAVEPSVRAGVLAAPGNPPANRQLAGRAALGNLLNSRQPSLLNPPGITVFGGLAVNPPHFHENMPLRNSIPLTVRLADNTTQVIQSPVTNDVPGAMAIQEVLENTEWASQAGSPVAYAPHLRKAPLAGVPAKSVIYQFAKGDEAAPNPNTTAILRAGDLADRTLYYRHDLARDEIPSLLRNPHGFVRRTDLLDLREIVLGAQSQIAVFFASDGTLVIHPEPARFFEVPIQEPLPEGLNYIP